MDDVSRLFNDIRAKLGSRLDDPEFRDSKEGQDCRANAILESIALPVLVNGLQSDVQSIADSLRLLSDKNASYLPFLERLRVISTRDYKMENARARSTSLGEFIEISIGFKAYAKRYARLAALALLGAEDSYRMVVRAVLQVEAEERKKGFVEDFPIPVWELFEDPMDVAYIEELATNIYLTVLTWTVLHEIAHHLLGHFDSELSARINALPDAIWRSISREQESQADRWAFQRMDELDYSLVEIYAFMTTLADLGKDPAAFENAYPTWSQRMHDLHSQCNLIKTYSTSRLVCFSGLFKKLANSESAEPIGKLHVVFPRNLDAFGSRIGSVIIDGSFQCAVTVVEQGQAHLYTRSRQGTVKIVIDKPDMLFSKILLFDVTPDGRENCFGILQHTFQTSFGLISKIWPKEIFWLVQGSLGDLEETTLDFLQLPPDRRANVINIYRRQNASIGELLLRYARSKIENREFKRQCSEAYHAAWHKVALEIGSELSDLIGPDMVVNADFQANIIIAMFTGMEATDNFHDLRPEGSRADIRET